MGQRANLIIVEGGQYELYYDHWCANALDAYLFWSMDRAITFFRSHEQQEPDWWLDDIWCEGGAVIDLDKRVLLWFGGEDICYDIPTHRLFLELMQKNWSGFQILWAHEGIANLADYVGYGRQKVLSPFDEEEIFDTAKIRDMFFPPERNHYWDCVLTIHNTEKEIEIYAVHAAACLQEVLFFGVDLLTLRKGAEVRTEYVVRPEDENDLHAGIHIDLPKKEIHLWRCFEEVLDIQRLQSVWLGYDIYDHQDRFEIQAELTDQRVRFVERCRRDLLQSIKQIVCRNSTDPLNTLHSLVSRLAEQGNEVKVSSAAYMASECKSDKSSLEALFDQLFLARGGESRKKEKERQHETKN